MKIRLRNEQGQTAVIDIPSEDAANLSVIIHNNSTYLFARIDLRDDVRVEFSEVSEPFCIYGHLEFQ